MDNMSAIIGSIVLGCLLYVVYITAATFIMWMAIDAGKNDKFWWMVLIIGVPFIGATVYYFVEKKREYMKIPKENVAKE